VGNSAGTNAQGDQRRRRGDKCGSDVGSYVAQGVPVRTTTPSPWGAVRVITLRERPPSPWGTVRVSNGDPTPSPWGTGCGSGVSQNNNAVALGYLSGL
jgi:hypothetical protein